MKSTSRDNFERMRNEADLRKLADMEALVGDLRSRLESVDQQIGDPDRLRKTIAPILSGALSDAGVDGSNSIATAMAPFVTDMIRSEITGALSDQERLGDAIAPVLSSALRDAGAEDKRPVAEAIAPYISETMRSEIEGTLSDTSRLRQAISPVISGALRDAGVADHGAVASSVAPYVVDTVRAEILNSQDELIEVIHPKLGVLIRAAVTNAVEELNRKVDEALPIDRWVAAAMGRLTGAASAGFLVGSAKKFQIKEALFIERKTGLLLAHQATSGAGETSVDEDMFAGMIAALQGFADDTFGASGAGDLRRFSFTEDTVYLRTSATRILAIRCNGVAPPQIESRIDSLLERALEQTREQGGYEGAQLLENLQEEAPPQSDVRASKVLGWGLGSVAASLLVVWGHGAVVSSNQARWIAEIDQVVLAQEGLGPYPVSVSLSEEGDTVRIAGLVKDREARERLKSSIEWVASPLNIDLDVDVIRADPSQ